MRYVTALILLFVFNASLFSQGNMAYKIINSNQLIVGTDTLIIDKTRITDILKQDEIEGLERLINGFDDNSGNGFEYEVKRGACILRFMGHPDGTYLLRAIKIIPSKNITVHFNDSISFNNMTEKVLLDLDCYEVRKLSDSLFNYQKIGVWLKILRSSSEIKLKSIRLHPKIIDEEIIRYLSRDKLN